MVVYAGSYGRMVLFSCSDCFANSFGDGNILGGRWHNTVFRRGYGDIS